MVLCRMAACGGDFSYNFLVGRIRVDPLPLSGIVPAAGHRPASACRMKSQSQLDTVILLPHLVFQFIRASTNTSLMLAA